MTFTASAPGKLLLIGDHAVVYGYPCLVTAVDQRLRVTAELIDEPVLQIEAPDIKLVGYSKSLTELGQGELPKAAAFLEQATKMFIAKYPLPGGVRLITDSDMSALFGFGSSSASTVAAVKALAELTGQRLGHHQIFELAYAAVLAVQGVGSGFDLAAAIWGGTIRYVTPAKVVEPLKLSKLPLLVCYSGVKADTPTLVKALAARREQAPDRINEIFATIGRLAEQTQPALEAENWSQAGEYFNQAQALLKELGVSSAVLDTLTQTAVDAGAWGAKLSGAGGGDCLIALVSEDKRSAVAEALTAAGGTVMNVDLQSQGLRIE